jgi:probable HAF family extracellular repeat protein
MLSVISLLLANVTTADADSYTITDLGTLGGTSSFAFGLNASGEVVGYSDVAGNTAQHAFLYGGGLNRCTSPLRQRVRAGCVAIRTGGTNAGLGVVFGVSDIIVHKEPL